MALRVVENGVVIRIRLKPHARRFAIRRTGDEIVVEVKSPPFEGKANEEMVRELSGFFGKPVTLLKGRKSRQKTVLIRGATLAETELCLDGIASSP
jgi:uncharacterized protein (TIGR00251 family)